jgi:hypothetical protein
VPELRPMKGNRRIGNENSEDELKSVGTETPFSADEYSQFGLCLEIAKL